MAVSELETRRALDQRSSPAPGARISLTPDDGGKTFSLVAPVGGVGVAWVWPCETFADAEVVRHRA